MALSLKEKHKLKRFVRILQQIRGRHTELVSVYIPAGYDLNKIIQHLAQEQGTAENIQDKTTRTHVVDSLERMIRQLRLYKRTPENGLAVFSGDASDKEGRADIQVWVLEPPEPINIRMYRCDQTFQLDPLLEMMETKEAYGLIVMDKREANIALLRGTQITELVEMTSAVPGKTRAGGQCLMPETSVKMADGQYLMVSELQKDDIVLSYDFEKKEFVESKILEVWDSAKETIYSITVNSEEDLECSADHVVFLEDGTTKAAEELKAGDKVIGEEGNSKPILNIKTRKSNVTMIDIKVEKENFLAAGIVVHNSAQRFSRIREEAAKEFFKRIDEAAMKEFLGMKNLKGILLGGPGPTKEDFASYLNNEIRRKIICIQDLSYTDSFGLRELVEKSSEALAKEAITEEKAAMEKFLKMLATKPNMVAYGKAEVQKALDMNAIEKLLISETVPDDLAEALEEKAELQGALVQYVSTDTTEGEQLRDLGGVAAFLRYQISN